jgi:hypothetical protein
MYSPGYAFVVSAIMTKTGSRAEFNSSEADWGGREHRASLGRSGGYPGPSDRRGFQPASAPEPSSSRALPSDLRTRQRQAERTTQDKARFACNNNKAGRGHDGAQVNSKSVFIVLSSDSYRQTLSPTTTHFMFCMATERNPGDPKGYETTYLYQWLDRGEKETPQTDGVAHHSVGARNVAFATSHV